jgi:hypothetical protein
LRLGNNARVKLPAGPATLTFGDGSAEEDVTEGAYLSVETAVPGAFIEGFTSFKPSTQRYGAGRGTLIDRV